jgi:hypothetical protein
MRRTALALIVLSLIAGAAFAVDPGHAQGAMTIDGNKVALNYAYAVGHQKNEVTNRKDDTRIVLTDKPLPDGVNLADIDYAFPDGTYGMVISVSRDDKISHIVVQHAKGMYDGGFFENDPNYTFRRQKVDQGIAGSLSSKAVKTNTMTFSFDVDFVAVTK